MPLRVMTWNLRTFGSNTTAQDIGLMARIINASNADIVCIQELQIGRLAGRKRTFGAVDPMIDQCVNDLCAALNNLLGGGANWAYSISDGNRGAQIEGNGMRDAYAFLFLTSPSVVAGHTINQIARNGMTIIQDSSSWSGYRRPAKISFSVTANAGGAATLLDILALHGATPVNSYNSSCTTRYMVQFAGGNFINQVTNVVTRVYPAPTNQTLVLGDFNYTPTFGNAYNGMITTLYSMRYAGADPGTTYSPVAANPATRTANVYDNILASNTMVFVGNGTSVDFINGLLAPLMATGLTMAAAFYSLYKRQHKPGGVSDHLPIYQDFTF